MRNSYIKTFLQKETSNSTEILLKEIFDVLNDGKVTIEDFYAAEKFWINVCNNEQTTYSNNCLSFWNRYETDHCPNLRGKWLSCGKLEKAFDLDVVCGIKRNKRIFTDKKDEQALKECCALKYFPFFH